MSEDIKQQIADLVESLDGVMEQAPSREVADLCNYLAEWLDNN